MPPLQDITHKFVSPLPPSSSPALSYIDEDENKINHSSAFLALPTSPTRPASNFVFSTPKAKLSTPGEGSDPFGFLAAERKLKLERGKDARRQPLAPLEPQRKRQKLNTPAHSSSSVAKLNQTQTPISADIGTLLTPPAIAPLHNKGKRRVERSFDNDDENNPFLLVSSPSVLSTPSPVKPRPRLSAPSLVTRLGSSSPQAAATAAADGGDNVENDENVNPFFSPALEDAPSVVSSVVVTPIRRRRKRDRMVLEEAQEEQVENVENPALADDPEVLGRALPPLLPKGKTKGESAEVCTPVKKKARTTKPRVRKEKEKEEPKEEGGGVQGGKRRSARLSKQTQPADRNKGKKEMPTRSVAKRKGKENVGKTSAPTKVKGKGKVKAKDREVDDVTETWERERAARVAYFKKLDSYELETENIFVV